MKKAVSLFFCILLVTLGVLPAFADLSEVIALVPPPDVSKAESVYMYHVDSDTLMLNKNTDTVRYPASTVKIMSGLMACQLCEGQLERQITITGQMLKGADGRVMGLEAGEIDNQGHAVRRLLQRI